MAIGDRIRFFRKMRGMTTRKLAEKCHINESYLSRVERNITEPHYKNLIRLSVALGVSINDLLADFLAKIGSDVQQNAIPGLVADSHIMPVFNCRGPVEDIVKNRNTLMFLNVSNTMCNDPSSKIICMQDDSMINYSILHDDFVFCHEADDIYEGDLVVVCLANGKMHIRELRLPDEKSNFLLLLSGNSNKICFPDHLIQYKDIKLILKVTYIFHNIEQQIEQQLVDQYSTARKKLSFHKRQS